MVVINNPNKNIMGHSALQWTLVPRDPQSRNFCEGLKSRGIYDAGFAVLNIAILDRKPLHLTQNKT